jgi:hypothetical protein
VPVAGREPYTQRVPYIPLQRWLETLPSGPLVTSPKGENRPNS